MNLWYLWKKRKITDLMKKKKNVWLTRKGIEVAQEYFRVPNLYDGKHVELVRHIYFSIKGT